MNKRNMPDRCGLGIGSTGHVRALSMFVFRSAVAFGGGRGIDRRGECGRERVRLTLPA
jgi:hypothetical protein